MEIVLVVSTLLGGVAAIWFFWDRIRRLSVRALLLRLLKALEGLLTRSDARPGPVPGPDNNATSRHCGLFVHFWDGIESSIASPPSGEPPGKYDLNLKVKALTSPLTQKVAFGKDLPDDASVDLIHLQSESVLPKDITLGDAGVREHDTLIFVYEVQDLDPKSICQIIRLKTGKLR